MTEAAHGQCSKLDCSAGISVAPPVEAPGFQGDKYALEDCAKKAITSDRMMTLANTLMIENNLGDEH